MASKQPLTNELYNIDLQAITKISEVNEGISDLTGSMLSTSPSVALPLRRQWPTVPGWCLRALV